jgi:catechol 2,3-dioxygenase-like lactoylglutathione lyase family enzyme
MVRLGSIVLNVSNLDRAAAFWSQALGHPPHPRHRAFLVPPEGGTRLHLDEDDRTHLDLWTDNRQEQQAEVERLVSLGAQRVDWEYPADADFVVLADTEGNLFCVIDMSATPTYG